MKITTWNVNGLRSALGKGMWDWVQAYSPDVLCLQEIKANPQQIMEEYHQKFQDYQVLWHPAMRPGYSGVVTFTRIQPEDTQIGIGIPYFDLEGRVVRTKYPGFHLFNIYFPNGQRDQNRLDYKLSFYEHLLGICDGFHGSGNGIILCGDFNTAHREIDLRNPKENEKNSGFLPEERAWIDRYLAHGFVDPYRVLYPNRVQYTWWTYRVNARQRNIGWRLDYFLVSQSLLPCIQDVIIHEDVPGSDHCPVTLVLT